MNGDNFELKGSILNFLLYYEFWINYQKVTNFDLH